MLTIHIAPGESALQRAIDALPHSDEPALIRLAPGVYREKVELRRPHTTLQGAGADKTCILWQDAAEDLHPDGSKRGTFRSYTLLVLAQDCCLQGLTVQNAAAPRKQKGQCVALFVDGDGFRCENCTLRSHQDTLFTAPLPPVEKIPGGFLGPTQRTPRTPQRQVYRACRIEGDVDFIFGGAAAWFEDCDIVSVSETPDADGPLGYATAASTPQGQKYGYVFSRCRFMAHGLPAGSCYLGRPWREHARTLLLRCRIDGHIRKEGWHDWNKADFHRLGCFAEFGCTGPGSDISCRAPFVHTLTPQEAQGVTLEDFMHSL